MGETHHGGYGKAGTLRGPHVSPRVTDAASDARRSWHVAAGGRGTHGPRAADALFVHGAVYEECFS